MALPMPNHLSMPTPPATKGKRPLRHLTATDKIEAIQRIHDGESKASVARDIGVPESTLRGWCKNEEKLRYMSRQSQENAEKLGGSAIGHDFLGAGHPEKRIKLEQSFFHNGKLKYDELQRYAGRNSMSGLDLSGSDKRLDYGSLGASEYTTALAQLNKNASGGMSSASKVFDMKSNLDGKTDLSMAAISPLTSLSHLSGISGLGQSPLSLTFNDIATNLNLLAQLQNPNMMSGMNSASGSSGSKGPRPLKTPSSLSPRAENDKSPSLTVKNLAKLQQKNSSAANSTDELSGMAALIDRQKKVTQSSTPPVDDALWYWLKSQQTMLGLNSLYNASMPRPGSPHSPAAGLAKIPTPPIAPATETPPISSTPDDKTQNTSWFWQWYKNFGNSFQQMEKPDSSHSNPPKNSPYENILFSQLTKPPAESAISNNFSREHSQSSSPKPEDLSSIPAVKSEGSPAPSPSHSEGVDEASDFKHTAKIKEELDNVLYNNNNNNTEKDDISEPDETLKNSMEAIEHGEKFLRWLESCSDPSVTAVQVMQFRLLITTLKSSAEQRGSGGNSGFSGGANLCEEKPKIRRRK